MICRCRYKSKNCLHSIINATENPCQYFLETLSMNRVAIINPDAPGEIIDNLTKMDIEPLLIPKSDRVDGPLAGHPDIQLFVHENRVFCHPDISASFASRIERHGEVIICTTRLAKNYPGDVPYNIACAGPWAFRYSAGTDPVIAEYLQSRKITDVGVSQGYAKCSTLIVDEWSIITADVSIHRAASSRRLVCLLITAGHIDLPGYGYGFIGGATGVCDDMVFCAGTLSYHPDYNAIEDFIAAQGKKIVPLGRNPAVDLGTIFVL